MVDFCIKLLLLVFTCCSAIYEFLKIAFLAKLKPCKIVCSKNGTLGQNFENIIKKVVDKNYFDWVIFIIIIIIIIIIIFLMFIVMKCYVYFINLSTQR